MKDILDLCRLNLIEENIVDSPAVDRDATLRAIDWKRRQLITKIAAKTSPASPEVMQRHLDQQIVVDDKNITNQCTRRGKA